MAHTLPALPYAKDALAPHISEETLELNGAALMTLKPRSKLLQLATLALVGHG